MKKVILFSAVLSAISLNVGAETPSFNFVQAGYTDGFDADMLNGFELKGNFEINDSLYLSAEYLNVSEDDDGDKVELDGYYLGVGFKSDITNDTAFFTQIDYVKYEAKVNFDNIGSLSGSDNGYQVVVGVRSNVTDSLELSAAAKYIDVVESDSLAEFGAVYNLTNALGLYADIETDFSDSRYAVGVRFSF